MQRPPRQVAFSDNAHFICCAHDPCDDPVSSPLVTGRPFAAAQNPPPPLPPLDGDDAAAAAGARREPPATDDDMRRVSAAEGGEPLPLE